MADNPYVNKVVYGSDTLIDISDTTATSEDVLNGKYFYSANGAKIQGVAVSGVTDVEVNGTSVVTNGIAEVTVPENTSDLNNDSGYITGMYIGAYGKSTFNEILEAYLANKVVYCRASSGSNPASGSQTRMAFLAYVNNETNPTEFEFQYYRSVATHTDSQQGDQVYIYKLNKSSGWSVTVRSTFTKIVAGTGLTSTYSNGTITISLSS